MSILRSAVVYVVAYIVLALPTYILPYVGSNSAMMHAVTGLAGTGLSPFFWAHVLALWLLVVLAWFRSYYNGRNWLPVLPFLAGVFDLVPGLNWILLVPTALHVAAIVVGSMGGKPAGQDQSPSGNWTTKFAVAGGVSVLLIVMGTWATYRVQHDNPWERQARASTSRSPAPTQGAGPPATPRQPTGNASTPSQEARPSLQAQNPAGASASTPPRAAEGPDPALALGNAPVDPSGTTITTGGFAGLKVGHTREQAEQFFGRRLPVVDHSCRGVRWQRLELTEGEPPLPSGFMELRDGKIVEFFSNSNRYQTRSGLKPGDPETRVTELYGRDSTLQHEPSPYPGEKNSQYHLGLSGPTYLTIMIYDGRIAGLAFGSTRARTSKVEECS